MRAVIQRVLGASVSVNQDVVGEIVGPGLVIYVGINVDDDIPKCSLLAEKIWRLRIFESGSLKSQGIEIDSTAVEVCAADGNLPILLISQFTLFADTSRGRRPTWQQAASGAQAEPLFNEVLESFKQLGATVATGQFGADMLISQLNDGPMTIILEV
jgi:D-tyrosyl-tRNA(Tyr) deacylase